MSEYSHRITKESIAEVEAKADKAEQEVKGCSQNFDLIITKVWIVKKAVAILPFQIEDAVCSVFN